MCNEIIRTFAKSESQADLALVTLGNSKWTSTRNEISQPPFRFYPLAVNIGVVFIVPSSTLKRQLNINIDMIDIELTGSLTRQIRSPCLRSLTAI